MFLIAVDTNVLLDQAIHDEDIIDALDVLRRKIADVHFVVTPTVLQELAYLSESGDQHTADAAGTALGDLLHWGYEPINLIPAGHGVVEQISLKLRMKDLLPEDEINDGLIIGEAALLNCRLLLSSDSHLLTAQENPQFREMLKACDVDEHGMVIATPRAIVKRYFPRR